MQDMRVKGAQEMNRILHSSPTIGVADGELASVRSIAADPARKHGGDAVGGREAALEKMVEGGVNQPCQIPCDRIGHNAVDSKRQRILRPEGERHETDLPCQARETMRGRALVRDRGGADAVGC